MKKFFKKIYSSLFINVIAIVVGIFAILGTAVCIIGNISFVNAFKNEYATVTYHMADNATIEVNGDHLKSYLNNEYVDEYNATNEKLDISCKKLNVSLIYVIVVDTSDYDSFISVFNVVNNEVDDSSYSPWPLGYQRKTTNDEYRNAYQNLYSGKSDYETLFRIKVTDGQHPHITTLVPVKNSTGEVVGLLCMQRPIREMEKAFAPYFRAIIISVIVMFVVAVAISVLFNRFSIIKPIDKVAKEAARFARENTKSEPLGKISHYQAFSDLANSIDSMESEMVKYIDNLTAVTAEKEKIQVELSIAEHIQKGSLPTDFPNRDDLEIYASMDPAKEVGGDFYNFRFIDDDHLAIIIADVSGKGVPAALMMMVTNILIANRAKMGGKPSQTLEYVNKDLYDHNNSGMFVTAWLGILELSTGRLVSANAGHEDPVVYRKGSLFMPVEEKHGFVLGTMADTKYINQEIILNKGDKLFLFTDGLTEATNANGQQYKSARMLRALNAHREEHPKELLASVKKDVNDFVKDAPQFDDLTMLCVELK